MDAFWPASGQGVCTAPGSQSYPAMIPDGAGGAIVVWHDARGGLYDIYAQRISATGVPQWTANGVPLCMAADNQLSPSIVSDGVGGAIVTWHDLRSGIWDVYAQRINSTGVPQWTANGVALCTASDIQGDPELASDGAGGAIVTWEDHRSLTSFDIYAQRVNAAGSPQWLSDGVGVCTGADEQLRPHIVSDGAGGAIIVWRDRRNGVDYDVYSQRVNAAGTALWSVGGQAVCTAPSDQVEPAITSDGATGAIVSWMDVRGADYDIYAQRLGPTGAPQWTVNGIGLCTAPFEQDYPSIGSDGAGGAIVAWNDYRGGGQPDIYAQRVLASGIIPASWPVNGRAISTAAGFQGEAVLATDGGSRAIVAWRDNRSGDNDIYAQLVAPSGFLGFPNPLLQPICDIPWDQGSRVKVSWDASYLDTDEPYFVNHYWVLRSAPSSRITSALAEGRVLTPEQFGAASDPVRTGAAAGAAGESTANALVVTGAGANSYYWEPLQRFDALHAVAGYSYVAPTTSDSTAGGNPLTAFMVIAYDYTGTIYLPSDPDSGYSVDNLPPGTPGQLTGSFSAGATHLHWSPDLDPDLAGYRVYRGGTPDFVPGPASLLATPRDTGFADAGPAGAWYKLSAVDIHGNESGFALLSPSGTTSVGGGPAVEFSLWRPAPNPARVTTRIGFSLPHDARLSLAIYDVAGRRERLLFEGRLPAGEHSQVWDLRDESGAEAPAGLYFVRLETEGCRHTQRFVASGR